MSAQFRRITPAMAREAYKETGLTPRPYRLCDDQGHACVMGALAVQLDPSLRDDDSRIQSVLLDQLAMPGIYTYGVAHGFNGELALKENDPYVQSLPSDDKAFYYQGYEDGRDARDAVMPAAGTDQ